MTLVAGGMVVTMNAARDVVPADVLVGSDGAIRELLPPGSPVQSGARMVDASGCLVVPGLVQAHILGELARFNGCRSSTCSAPAPALSATGLAQRRP